MEEYCTPGSSPAASDARCRAFNAQLRVTYTDGSQQVVSTQPGHGWTGTTKHNPVTYSHIYHGEKRDDRLLQPGWDEPGFGAASHGWEPAEAWPMAGNLGSLDLHEMPPIGPAAVLQPVSRKPLDPEGGGAQERWLYDFGVNIAGFARLNVTALVPPGSESVIQMKHAETANEHGVVNAYCGGQSPCVVDDYTFNKANQTNELTLRSGVPNHTFTPFSACKRSSSLCVS